jgi:hypothetical protein
LLPYELKKLTSAGGNFLIHLGDICDGKPDVNGEPSDCPEALFQTLSIIFEDSPVTVFFIPGDNG